MKKKKISINPQSVDDLVAFIGGQEVYMYYKRVPERFKNWKLDNGYLTQDVDETAHSLQVILKHNNVSYERRTVDFVDGEPVAEVKE